MVPVEQDARRRQAVCFVWMAVGCLYSTLLKRITVAGYEGNIRLLAILVQSQG